MTKSEAPISAKALLDFAYPKYRSKAEREYAEYLDWIAKEDGIVDIRYEPLRFKIPGGHYTPDFMTIFDDGHIRFIEVKGTKHQQSYRDSRAKLRAAATVYPWFEWFMAAWDNSAKTFTHERIKPQ